MADSEADVLARLIVKTLDAASHAVQQNRAWADRVRENWNAVERHGRADKPSDCRQDQPSA